MVLCVDEKTQVQALYRTQPLLPMGLGWVEGVTHDYIRHGTTTLLVALDVATGEVRTQCKSRHRHQEFLCFLRQIEKSVPEDHNVHLIVDNICTHKHAKACAGLAQRPRFHVHYTPTNDAAVAVDLQDVPEDRLAHNLHHRLGPCAGFLGDPGPQPSDQDHGFHADAGEWIPDVFVITYFAGFTGPSPQSLATNKTSLPASLIGLVPPLASPGSGGKEGGG